MPDIVKIEYNQTGESVKNAANRIISNVFF